MTPSQRKRKPLPGHRVTSLELPVAVWQALKIRAAMEGCSLRAVLLAAVERYLSTDVPPALPPTGDME